jgi:hypothetical protein
MVHTQKGVTGTYSNWSLFSSDHVLDGFPDAHVEPGAGAFPHGIQLSRWYRGLRTVWPLDDSGGGTRLSYARFRPLEFKGVESQKAFATAFGHADRENAYALQSLLFDGLDSAKAINNPGHAKRSSGGAANFGHFDPHVHKGLDLAMEADFGQAVPAGYDNSYGHNRVNEHRGVTASVALNVS